MTATPAAEKRRSSLWVRIALLGVVSALVTGAVAGLLAINLIRSADDRNARRELGNLAIAAQNDLAAGRPHPLKRRVLRALRVHVGVLTGAGAFVQADPLVRLTLTAGDRAQLAAGRAVSASRDVRGRHVYLEARPVDSGAIVLVEARSDATAGGEAALRRTLLAILLGVGASALLAVLLARWLARPLRRTADAARALAAGRRDVIVPPDGPKEVADVATAVNALSAALAHSEARQREFLLSVSHDLRTPLTAIVGYGESLAGSVVPPERTAEVGQVVLAEARRLERLVGDLLDLARLDATDVALELGPVDLVALARAAAAVWSTRCARAGVEFRLEAAPALAWADAARLRQVLDGLMENALRVTPAGAPIVLAVGVEPDGRARAEVRDGGPGLRPDDLPVAFERGELYRRYRGVRQVGTGLGLAIVQRLVQRQGGTVEAGQAPEGGARFTVRLPPGLTV